MSQVNDSSNVAARPDDASIHPVQTRGIYAHTTDGPPETWEPLERHLAEVADGEPAQKLLGAAAFADVFGASDWGRLLGLWHDIGKFSAAFQNYLRRSRACGSDDDVHTADTAGRVDHSTAGAQLAVKQFGFSGRLLAYCIAGHHAGLPDWESGASGLRQRLRKSIEPYDGVPAELLNLNPPDLPTFRWSDEAKRLAFQISFFTRMLFSCLVDADFLATERFMNPQRADLRPSNAATPADLLDRLNSHLDGLVRSAPDTTVNQQRDEVLRACRTKAPLPPGLFSLNVPTGGGKTYSSLAFALEHAAAHDLRRVIYAVPFTSIIEQTANNFRRALDDLAEFVLEHHSNVDPDDPRRQTERTRLAAENFNAPLIVTTNVQLFESLFACRTSRCRKLHRLARSVIVLDEAQTLPPELLAPTLAALDELARNYGATIVLCTATQPAIERRESFPIGLEHVRPIIDDPLALHQALRRTTVDVAGTLDDDVLAQRLADEPQALCIVNSRRHAADLFRGVADLRPTDECFHLSANMCPAHRVEVVTEVRRRLSPEVREPCLVVSTQVIEAGVDVDFPAVYRAAAGLDSIAQAAGRCNREGRLADDAGEPALGRVIVFDYDEQAHRAPPFIRHAADSAREVIPEHADDVLSPEAIERFFHLHYWRKGGDNGRGWDRGRGEGRPSVLDCFAGKGLKCQFRTAAERYRLIDDAQTAVLVPWGKEGEALRRELESMPDLPGPEHLRSWDRRAQRYAVGVFDRDLKTLLENHVLRERHGRFYLANDRAYRRDSGLDFEVLGLSPEALMG